MEVAQYADDGSYYFIKDTTTYKTNEPSNLSCTAEVGIHAGNLKEAYIRDRITEMTFVKNGEEKADAVTVRVTKIVEGTFKNCKQLRTIQIPFIGTYSGEGNLHSLFGPDSGDVVGTVLEKIIIQSYYDTYNIVELGEGAFQNFTKLKSVVFTDSISI